MKMHRVLRNLLIDAALAGAALTVFALFHHVLPRQQEGLGSVISNPYQTETPDSGTAAALPENTRTAEAPGASGTPMLSAKGRKKNNGRSMGGGMGGAMSGKGGSALTGEADEPAAKTDGTPISEKFADKYTDTVVVTENSYSSPDIAITVSEETSANGRVTYYLADI